MKKTEMKSEGRASSSMDVRVALGAVFEFDLDNSYAYAMYCVNSKRWGTVIQIVMARFCAPVVDVQTLFFENRTQPFITPVKINSFRHNPKIRTVGIFKIPTHLRRFPLFRSGVVAPEVALFQAPKIWDGERSFDPNEMPEVVIGTLTPNATFPIGDILKEVAGYPLTQETRR